MFASLLQHVAQLLCPPPRHTGYRQAESCFTADELDAMRTQYCLHVLNKYSQGMDDAHFLEWAGLQGAPPVLQQGLCRVVRSLSGDTGAITLQGVIMAKARCEKMDRESAQDFAFDVMDPQSAGHISRAQLQRVVAACLELALPAAEDTAATAAAAASSNSATAAAISSGCCRTAAQQQAPAAADALTRPGYARLCRTVPALQASLCTLLASIGRPASSSDAAASQHAATAAAGHPPSSAPEGQPSAHTARSSRAARSAQRLDDAAGPGPSSGALAAAAAAAAATAAAGPGRVLLPQLLWGQVAPLEALLQPGWVWLLAAGLAPVQRLEWRMLFNSQKHGISFTTFMGRLGEAAPTLLLIRDKGGAVFGGVAHSPWKKAGEFYGDHASMIFRLLPDVQLYPAMGINSNIQWCGAGFSQLPNGIGFGGQVGHYGLWLDATFDHGMSRPSATFGNPSLSSQEVFQVDVVEAWQLLPPEDTGPAGAPAGGAAASVLSKAQEDQRILELAGVRSNYSAALKDEPIED